MSKLRFEVVDKSISPDEISMQPTSLDIWDKKCRLKTRQGEALDADIDATYLRVARTLADAESSGEKHAHWFERFTWALQRGAIPAGLASPVHPLPEHWSGATGQCTPITWFATTASWRAGSTDRSGLSICGT